MKKFFTTYYPGIILFCAAMLIGMLTYQDYGMAWDEPAQHLIGTVNYNYVFNNDTTLFTFVDKEYGAGFELPLIMLEKAMHITDSRDVYLMRHIVNHTFFLISMFIGYMLIYRLFKNQFLACLGFIMLAFAPRIYAHSFYNTKDIPFMCMVLVSLAICQIAFEHRKPLLFLLLGFSLGYTTGIRIMAIMPVSIILFFLCIDTITSCIKKDAPAKAAISFMSVILGFCTCLYVSCPFFWLHPIDNFMGCFDKLAGKGFCGMDLINGKYESSLSLPWYYLPEWITITTPELWAVAGVAGIILLIFTMLKQPLHYFKNTPERNFLLYFLCFAAPLCAVIVLHSVVYDEWRHLYFIYPSFVLIALYGINRLLNSKLRLLVIAACSVQTIFIGYFMIANHPFQQVYFNAFVPHNKEYLRTHFEFDYWGCSIKQALDNILKTDQRPLISVGNLDFGPSIENNILMLPAQDRKRLMIVSPQHADYVITTFRGHPLDFEKVVSVFDIQVLNSTIVRVYKKGN